MGLQTPLYQQHVAANGKIVDFSGWDMPLHYGSQIKEHQQVRDDAGMFDVSHMTIVDVQGSAAQAYLQYLLANDVAKLTTTGKALYSAMLNTDGGVIDDLIVYLMPWGYRTVVNCGTREKDLAWMAQVAADFDVTLTERPELAMIAVQGPTAIQRSLTVMSPAQQAAADLAVFQGLEADDWFIARTGYTGEDGFEIMLPAEQAAQIWQQLVAAGVQPCGLGCRDSLRLEAGMNLYGNEMDDSVSPLNANMGWTLAWTPEQRDFIGRAALTQQKQQGVDSKLVGLLLQQKGMLRAHQIVHLTLPDENSAANATGEITSGTFSPTINASIAMARVPAEACGTCYVEIRGKYLAATIVSLPFVRHGKAVFKSS